MLEQPLFCTGQWILSTLMNGENLHHHPLPSSRTQPHSDPQPLLPSPRSIGYPLTLFLCSYAERLTTRHIFYKWSHCAAFYSYLCELNRVLKANPRYSVCQHFFLLPNSILLHKYKLFHQSLDNWAVSMCQLPWIMLPRTSVNNVLCRHVYSRRLPLAPIKYDGQVGSRIHCM